MADTPLTERDRELLAMEGRPMGLDAYEEACEAEVTLAQAQAEIAKHDVPGGFAQFLADVGQKDMYVGREILNWLGY